MRGDLLFWTSDGSPASRLIAFLTRGPYVHVSVDLGDGHDIGAHSDGGVRVRPLPERDGIVRWSPRPTFTNDLNISILEEQARIEKGIDFLRGEVGNPYGWCNIANNALKLLHLPYRLARTDRYDCSSLVTRYLERLGIWLGDLSEEPDSVSPNDLARALGLIK